MTFTTNHLSGAKAQAFSTNHLAGSSKPNLTATKLQHKTNSYK